METIILIIIATVILLTLPWLIIGKMTNKTEVDDMEDESLETKFDNRFLNEQGDWLDEDLGKPTPKEIKEFIRDNK